MMELGSTVTLTYTGRLEDGTVFGTATVDEPMVFQTGMDLAIKGFEAAVMELAEGDKSTFTVGMYDAYGERLDDLIQRVPLENIPYELEVGRRLWMLDGNGVKFPTTVLEITDGEAVLDCNHPLAGNDLIFDVEILKVEPAPADFVSAEELAKRTGQANIDQYYGEDNGGGSMML